MKASLENRIKCRWCAYTCQRFRGYKKHNTNTLMWHVLENHSRTFLDSIGFAGTLQEYLDREEDEDDE